MAQILITLYILSTSGALVVLKIGSKAGAPISFAAHKLQLNLNLYTTLGILLYGISFLVYTYLISKYELGYIIPLLAGFVYILIFVASYLIFKESFTIVKTLGIVLILAGIIVLNYKK